MKRGCVLFASVYAPSAAMSDVFLGVNHSSQGGYLSVMQKTVLRTIEVFLESVVLGNSFIIRMFILRIMDG